MQRQFASSARQLNVKLQAAVGRLVQPHPAAIGAHQLVDDREAKPRTRGAFVKARAYGGTIALGQSQYGGLKVDIELPRA